MLHVIMNRRGGVATDRHGRMKQNYASSSRLSSGSSHHCQAIMSSDRGERSPCEQQSGEQLSISTVEPCRQPDYLNAKTNVLTPLDNLDIVHKLVSASSSRREEGNLRGPAKQSVLVQGALDMLILRTLALEPMHGYGIGVRLEQISQGVFRINAGSLFPAFDDWSETD
jgi:hypothetical protein